jgi:hypothetical protein
VNVAYEAAIDQFQAWLTQGINNGWITTVHCLTHDGPQLDWLDEEAIEDDFCVPIVIVRGPQ